MFKHLQLTFISFTYVIGGGDTTLLLNGNIWNRTEVFRFFTSVMPWAPREWAPAAQAPLPRFPQRAALSRAVASVEPRYPSAWLPSCSEHFPSRFRKLSRLSEPWYAPLLLYSLGKNLALVCLQCPRLLGDAQPSRSPWEHPRGILFERCP